MFDKERIEKIIKDNYEGFSGEHIAIILNRNLFTTKNGKAWTQSNVSYYALKVLGLDRKHKEFTKSVAQKQDTILTPEVKTENLTEVKELNPLQASYKNHFEEVNKTALIETAIFEKQGKFFTDSLAVAKIFDREHNKVILSIENLECSETFRSRNFLRDVYFDNNRQYPKVNLTKDGFSFLVMGFTGEKAGKFKEKFIERFNELEESVKIPKPALYTSELDLIIASANQIKVIAERQTQTELKVNSLENKVNNIIVNFPRKRNYNPQPIHQDTLFEMEEKTLSYQAKTYKRVMAYSIHINTPENRIFNSIYAIFDDTYNKDIKKECEIYNLRNKTKFSILAYIDFIGMSKELWEVTQNNLLFNVQKVGS